MKTLKRGLFICVMSIIGLGGVFLSSPVQAQIDTDFPYNVGTIEGEDTTDFGQLIKDDAVDPDDSASEQIQEAYKIDFEAEGEQRATFYIKEIINWFLAITGMVALVVLLFGFYKMFVAKENEEGLKEARKTVISAVIALFVIGTARIVVSQFFDIFFRVKGSTNV